MKRIFPPNSTVTHIAIEIVRRKLDQFGFAMQPRRWVVISARALPYESPMLAADGSMPASVRRSVHLIETYWFRAHNGGPL